MVKELFQKLHPGEKYYLTNIQAFSLDPEEVREWSDDLWLFPYYVDRSFVPYDARPGGPASGAWPNESAAVVGTYLAYLKRQRPRIVKRGRDIEYLRRLVGTLRPMMDHRERYPAIEVYLVLSDRCDARSFPGGYLVFFRGLLETADNEAALIGIVGHELSHLDRGHHTRRIKQMKLAERTFSGREGAISMEKSLVVGGVMMRAWLRPFRSDHEKEADTDGARWSYQAGYDCREMAKLFLKLHDRGGNLALPIPEFFRSHPTALDRHRAILEEDIRLQSERPKDRLHVGKENLRLRTVRGP